MLKGISTISAIAKSHIERGLLLHATWRWALQRGDFDGKMFFLFRLQVIFQGSGINKKMWFGEKKGFIHP